MSIQKISFSNNVNFKGNSPKPENTLIKDNNPQTETGNNKKKIALALGGLGIAGAAAVIIKSKGKNNLSKLSIEKFKEIGKFDKGFASIKNKPFTGTIEVPSKDGKFIIEYADGVLKQSTKFKEIVYPEYTKLKPQMMPVMKKVYSAEDGIKTVDTFKHNENINIFGGKEWARTGAANISNDKITIETPMGTNLLSKKVTEKLPDGTFKQSYTTNSLPDGWYKN